MVDLIQMILAGALNRLAQTGHPMEVERLDGGSCILLYQIEFQPSMIVEYLPDE